MNSPRYVLSSKCALALMLSTMIYLSCSDSINNSINQENTIDKTKSENKNPIPGNDGILIITKITSTYLNISWEKGKDNDTPQELLSYKIFRSSNNNLDNFQNAELYGTSVSQWENNINSIEISSLEKSTIYYFNVFIKDQDDNISAYQTVSATTASMDFPPLAGNNGTLILQRTNDKIILQWDKSLDNETKQNNLAYAVFTSDNYANLTMYNKAVQYGTLVSDWTNDIAAIEIPELSYNGSNYYNVFVKDNHNNISAYTSINYTNYSPIPGMNGQLTAVEVNGTMQLLWHKATDVETNQANLLYLVIRGTKKTLHNYHSAINTGTILLDWTTDITSYIDTDYSSETKYYYNVFVKDEDFKIEAYTYTQIITD